VAIPPSIRENAAPYPPSADNEAISRGFTPLAGINPEQR
jgi:hypothetical protein